MFSIFLIIILLPGILGMFILCVSSFFVRDTPSYTFFVILYLFFNALTVAGGDLLLDSADDHMKAWCLGCWCALGLIVLCSSVLLWLKRRHRPQIIPEADTQSTKPSNPEEW
jgi:hypothetical protein